MKKLFSTDEIISGVMAFIVMVVIWSFAAGDSILVLIMMIAACGVRVAVEALKRTRAQKEGERKNLNEFYEECQRFGIVDLKNPDSAEKKQRLELIVKKYGYSLSDAEFVQRFNTLYGQKQQAMKAEKSKAEEAAKQRELEQYAELTHYAQFHGTDKPVTMFKDLAESARGSSISYIPMKKESDGAIMAGMASGIGGTVPALMSLSQTAKSNESVRAANQLAEAVNAAAAEAYFRASQRAHAYQDKADELAVKLVGDMPSKEVFQYLKFENIQTEVSEVGTVTVKAEASVKGTVTVFDKPGFVDGYVMAEIYDGVRKIGEAIMVFPAHGSLDYRIMYTKYGVNKGIVTKPDEPVKLEGICLNCGEQGKKYTVKFVPGDLWIMEQ